ncbi:hypothetical protein VR7878_03643 [Vibrio ruber DSM 16370]|uniref:Uncharacterized protein n=1 Tax=Vibrio ruber (strain DSM 16370 / JCM 11486 / BCRC 17186 / CECT 7878 / LMG 23124 / VR1) TaxID=1123498 RepID=A0A1R4LTB8_VIBR1|nr:hypothetical protein [Vibrio ruber]SJN59748.1 hypothetical protein VR7878_03643 [Vibrio ruber DSM 16370]
MRSKKVIASQTSSLSFLPSQLLAPKFDAQLCSSISEALMFCAPVHLSEMKDEPENLFCWAWSHVVQNQLLRASCPEKPNHSSMNGFLGLVVDLNKVKH